MHDRFNGNRDVPEWLVSDSCGNCMRGSRRGLLWRWVGRHYDLHCARRRLFTGYRRCGEHVCRLWRRQRRLLWWSRDRRVRERSILSGNEWCARRGAEVHELWCCGQRLLSGQRLRDRRPVRGYRWERTHHMHCLRRLRTGLLRNRSAHNTDVWFGSHLHGYRCDGHLSMSRVVSLSALGGFRVLAKSDPQTTAAAIEVPSRDPRSHAPDRRAATVLSVVESRRWPTTKRRRARRVPLSPPASLSLSVAPRGLSGGGAGPPPPAERRYEG